MKNEVVVSKMLTYIDKILRYTEGMVYGTFVVNELVMEACVFNLENWRIR